MLRKSIISCSFATGLAVAANAPLAQTSNPQSNSLSALNQQFVQSAMEDEIFEITLGVLAQVNGRSEKVLRLGEMIDKDLGHHWPELVDAAKQLGLIPPKVIDVTKKPIYDRLYNLSGKQFDQAFLKTVVSVYEKNLDAYENEAKSDSRIGAWARQIIPLLEKHLQAAQLLSEESAQDNNVVGTP